MENNTVKRNNIKALFFDLDGTVLSFKTHNMSESTINALREAKRRGVKLFVATGRHISDMTNIECIDFDGFITLNGAYCTAENKLIFSKSIPQQDIEAFVHYDMTVERIPCFFIEADKVSANGVFDITERMMKLVEFPPRPVVDSIDFINKEIFQMTAFFSKEKEEGIMKLLKGCNATRWYPTFSDIIAKGVDKGVGIRKMINYFGIDKENTMAFGDGGNDISMIHFAQIGVAMGNATEDVKQSADYVTSSVDEDGIYKALIHFGVI